MTDPTSGISDADPAVVVRKERFKPPSIHRQSASRILLAVAPAAARAGSRAIASPRTGQRVSTQRPQVARTQRPAQQAVQEAQRKTGTRTERREDPDAHSSEGKHQHPGKHGGPHRPGPEDSGQGSGDHGGEREERPPGEHALSLDIPLFHAALATAEAAPPVPLSCLSRLVAQVEVLMRQTQLPSLAITLTGELAGRIELLKTGPGCVRIHVGSRSRWSLRNRQSLEAELHVRGIRVTVWTQGKTS